MKGSEKVDAIAWIGLNPSTADENQLDPTLRRIASFTRKFGGNGFVMLNLFAFRATDPRDMKMEDDPVGILNDDMIYYQCAMASKIVLAWGTHGDHMGRDSMVVDLIHEFKGKTFVLRKTSKGFPSHPLYLPKSCDLQRY